MSRKVRNIDRPEGVDWREGVKCLGYWPEGKSYVFTDKGVHFCITGSFLKWVYSTYTGQDAEAEA